MNLNVSLLVVRGEINAISGCLASQGVQDCIPATKVKQVTELNAHRWEERNNNLQVK